jgi:hypothetical protein
MTREEFYALILSILTALIYLIPRVLRAIRTHEEYDVCRYLALSWGIIVASIIPYLILVFYILKLFE